MSAMMRLLAILCLLLPRSSGDQRSKHGYCQELAHNQCVGVPHNAPDEERLICSSRFRKRQRNASESRRAAIWIRLGSQNQAMKVIVDLNELELAESNGSSDLSQTNMRFCSQLALSKRDDFIRGPVNWPRLRPQSWVNSNCGRPRLRSQFWVDSNWGWPRLRPRYQADSNWGANIPPVKSPTAFTNT